MGKGKIDILEVGHLLKKNPLPFLETLGLLMETSKDLTNGSVIDASKVLDKENFISKVKGLVRERPAQAKVASPKVPNLSLNFVPLCLVIVVIAYFCANSPPYILGPVTLGLIVTICIIIPSNEHFTARRFRLLEENFPKIIRYLETHEDFATINELSQAVGISKKLVIDALTAFGSGARRQAMLKLVSHSESEAHNTANVSILSKDTIWNLKANIPPEELFCFLPQVDGVMKIPKVQVPFQLEQEEFETLWGMLLFEKRIDFAITSNELHLPKYHLLRVIYKIFATTPMKFKFTDISVDLLEEKDLGTFFAALKEQFAEWKNPTSNFPERTS